MGVTPSPAGCVNRADGGPPIPAGTSFGAVGEGQHTCRRYRAGYKAVDLIGAAIKFKPAQYFLAIGCGDVFRVLRKCIPHPSACRPDWGAATDMVLVVYAKGGQFRRPATKVTLSSPVSGNRQGQVYRFRRQVWLRFHQAGVEADRGDAAPSVYFKVIVPTLVRMLPSAPGAGFQGLLLSLQSTVIVPWY